MLYLLSRKILGVESNILFVLGLSIVFQQVSCSFVLTYKYSWCSINIGSQSAGWFPLPKGGGAVEYI